MWNGNTYFYYKSIHHKITIQQQQQCSIEFKTESHTRTIKFESKQSKKLRRGLIKHTRTIKQSHTQENTQQ
jgi:hypothetical protein